MRKDKQGKRVFETLTEGHNYLDTEFTEEKIKAAAKKRPKKYAYECRNTQHRVLINAASRIKDKTTRDIYCFLVNAGTRQVNEKVAIAYLSSISGLTVQQILLYQRKGIEEIKNYLENQRIIPTVGESIIEMVSRTRINVKRSDSI